MKVVLFGCRPTTRYLFERLSERIGIAALVTISPETAAKQQVAGYDDLSDLGGDTELYVARRYALTTDEDRAYFEAHRFDVAYVAGWQRLIPDPVLQTIARGAYGMHGSARDLPYGRGRSPLNWSLIEGRGWFFTNLFRYLPGADDGPIVDTSCFSINASDTAETLHFKNLLAMVEIVERNHAAIAAGDVPLREQAAGEPTYYPKRTPDDGLIDWDADVHAVERFIRAVGPPFSGAFSFLGGAKLVIERATLFYTDLEAHPFRGEAPGTICAVLPNGKFCLRCGGGVLLVHEHRLEGEGGIAPGARLESPEGRIRRFPRNAQGYFDLPAETKDGG